MLRRELNTRSGREDERTELLASAEGTGYNPVQMTPVQPSQEPDRADFYSAAVYGSIIAATLLAAFREEHESAETVLFALLSTLIVFYIAHVWSTIVGERVHVGRHFELRHVGIIAVQEWPLVGAAALPSVALLLGWAGALSDVRAIDLAAALCIVELLAWGFAVGHRAYEKWWQAVLMGVADGALGLAIVSLELIFVH